MLLSGPISSNEEVVFCQCKQGEIFDWSKRIIEDHLMLMVKVKDRNGRPITNIIENNKLTTDDLHYHVIQ